MKIIIAVDSFKGTLSSIEVAKLIDKYIDKENNTVDIISTGDGGEGTVDSLMYAIKGEKKEIKIHGALGNEIDSYYCLCNNRKTAIMEIALSSGIATLKENELNPFKTSSYGLGETINDALEEGAKKLIIGIGGSSTNDAGAGMLKSLGVKFYDKDNKEIKILNGYSIGLVEKIDISGLNHKLKDVFIEVACDVDNPLLGKNGCSYIYGEQKGADAKMIEQLEKNMLHYANVVSKELGVDHSNEAGSGAAGGLGYGLITFLGAKLLSGFEIVSDATNLEERIKYADLVITGEGSFDHQSLNGKAPVKIARLAKKHNKKVIGIFALTSIASMPEIFDEIISVVPTVATKKESLADPRKYLEKLIKQKCIFK